MEEIGLQDTILSLFFLLKGHNSPGSRISQSWVMSVLFLWKVLNLRTLFWYLFSKYIFLTPLEFNI